MKYKVALPEGIRIHRADNTFFDLQKGDVVDEKDVPRQQLTDRLTDKHLVPVGASAKAEHDEESSEREAKGKKK